MPRRTSASTDSSSGPAKTIAGSLSYRTHFCNDPGAGGRVVIVRPALRLPVGSLPQRRPPARGEPRGGHPQSVLGDLVPEHGGVGAQFAGVAEGALPGAVLVAEGRSRIAGHRD